MFNGIRGMDINKLGYWYCYDTDIRCIFSFKDGKLLMIMEQLKPNPAGGWYRVVLA